MKSKLYFLFFFIILSCSSCSDNTFEETEETPRNTRSVQQTEIITPEDASNIASEFFCTLNPDTRASWQGNPNYTTVETITTLSLPEKNTSANDTILYLVNNGITPILVSAASDGPGVLAFFDSPNISMSSILNNPSTNDQGLLAVLSPVLTDDMLGIHHFYDSIRTHHNGRFWDPSDPIIVTSVEPKVKVFWDQEEPFNNYIPNNYLAGCVAIAAAQAFTVTRHVTNFRGLELNYDNLIKVKHSAFQLTYPSETDTIARLIRLIGDAVNTDYGAIESPANTNNAIELFTDEGLMNLSRNKGDIQRTLQNYNDGIVIISSRTETDFLWWQRGKGHAYIVDGFKKRSNDLGYLHINYGFGPGSINGYFLEDLMSPHFTEDAPYQYPHEWKFYCLYNQ